MPAPGAATPPAADRNLLFGVIALQMNFVTREALIAGMHAWVLDKSKPLGRVLLDQGALRLDAHDLLDALVAKHLELYGNEPARSLAAVGAPALVREELSRIADLDLEASLAHVPAALATDDPQATRTYAVGTPTSAGLRFRVLRPHAQGGLGQVSVALDEELHREVALKEIQERHAHDPASRARFLLEAEVTGSLEHPGIVPVYGLGTYADGRPFYAMRLVRGDSLKEAIDRFHQAAAPGRDVGQRVVAFRQLLGRFVAVCNTVAYAHSRGVLHRDLKPQNVMLGPYGETLVVDWGLAKTIGRPEGAPGSAEATFQPASADGAAETQAGSALGTPAYMSPEQAAGRLDELGPASDVYGLGATLYCLLTGRAPFADTEPAGGPGGLLRRVQRGEFPPPRAAMSGRADGWDVPAALEAVCLKAMALRPGERYATPRALADDVERWLADEPVAAHPEPARLRLRRWVRKHRGPVGTAAALAAVAATVAVGWALVAEAGRREAREQGLRQVAEDERAEADRQRALVRRYLYFSQIHLADRAWQDAQVRRMDQLLNGLRAPASGGEDLRGFEWYYLNRLPSNTLLLTLPGWSARFSPDGKKLATVGEDKTARVWEAAGGRELLALRGHTDQVIQVAFSPDGRKLATASSDRTARVWDAATGREVLTLRGHTDSVIRVAFSPDGQRLATSSLDHTVRVWDAATGRETFSLMKDLRGFTPICFSPDGKRLVTASYDPRIVRIVVWDAATGRELRAFRSQAGALNNICFSPDGKRLAGASVDGTARVWDADTGQEVLALRGHTGDLLDLAFSPDGERLATTSRDQTARVWDSDTGRELRVLRGHTDVGSVAFSPDGTKLATASGDGMTRVWDAARDQESLVVGRHTRKVHGLAFNPDGQRLASAADDGVIVWDTTTGRQVLDLRQYAAVARVAFSPDGRRLAGASGHGMARVWDAATGREILTLDAHVDFVLEDVAFSPDGGRMATASGDGPARVWDAATGRELLTIRQHPDSVIRHVVFSPDGRRLATGSDDGVRLWDAASGAMIVSMNLDPHDDAVTSVCFSPDGKRLATSRLRVLVWDAATGRQLLEFRGHDHMVLHVAFSPDGTRLATGSEDDTARLWDAATGEAILTFKGHSDSVTCACFSPDGNRLATTSDDGTVRLWDASPSERQRRPK